jgi:hypothetical protein
MTDASTDPVITRNPSDYLAPVSGSIPWLLVGGVYLIAFLIFVSLVKNSRYE